MTFYYFHRIKTRMLSRNWNGIGHLFEGFFCTICTESEGYYTLKLCCSVVAKEMEKVCKGSPQFDTRLVYFKKIALALYIG